MKFAPARPDPGEEYHSDWRDQIRALRRKFPDDIAAQRMLTHLKDQIDCTLFFMGRELEKHREYICDLASPRGFIGPDGASVSWSLGVLTIKENDKVVCRLETYQPLMRRAIRKEEDAR